MHGHMSFLYRWGSDILLFFYGERSLPHRKGGTQKDLDKKGDMET